MVKYLQHPEVPRCEMTCSTSYSSLVPIKSGGGFEKFGSCASVSYRMREEKHGRRCVSSRWQVGGGGM